MESEETLTKMARVVDLVRERTPLVHCITNYVTVNDCANILLAFGASPAMVDAREDAREFARISGALYLNCGTYLKEQEEAAREAAQGAALGKIPIVIDPVGCAAIPRRGHILDMVAEAAPAAESAPIGIVKGNAAEILALAGERSQARGMDSLGEAGGAAEACAALARKYRCAVAATGRVDVVSDGERTLRVHNGCELLTRITGAGCMAGALCAAAAAVCPEDPLIAAAAAITAFCVAGEMAGERAPLPGSFRAALVDAVYQVSGAVLRERGRIE